ncbi:XdhC family protein [Streptomyces sp. NPDC005727]|uniref:XdhC family protein n=1 Tax=Streptomyces sp. NPDC005727 TaxID=3157053 RepID=UPI0033DB9A97
MRDVLSQLLQWHEEGTAFALATVVAVRGSAPRLPGAVMAVNGAGEAVGSVSGGCVEGAVYQAATEVLETGQPQLETYGIGDEDAFSVGLTCGGTLEVLVQRVGPDSPLGAVLGSLDRTEPVAVATVTGGGAPLGAQLYVWPDRTRATLGDPELDAAVADDARSMLTQGVSGAKHYGAQGQRRMDEVHVLVQSFAPPPRMLVFGAIDFAAALSRIGAHLGYRVTVCDARPVFATRKRFPDAHEVVRAWPHDYLAATEVDERTVVCVLTHDPKFDVPLLLTALRTPAGYIGVMGSRRTHDDRFDRLRETGVTEAELARLASPIGLDLGARTPEETALSIAAEILVTRTGATGRRLATLTGPIHASAAPGP